MRLLPAPKVVPLATAALAALALLASSPAQAPKPAGKSPLPMFGGTPQRNLANIVDKDIPDTWSVKKGAEKNVKWVARLGGHAYGGPVVAGGRVFVGTNNEKPRDPKVKGDKGVVMCFRESDGKFLWQAVHDKLPVEANDWPREGVASTPTVDGDRLYYVSNRCELVCADVAGDEATGKAKILWTYDLVGQLGVYPCQLANCSPLVYGDLIYVVTCNGVDQGTGKLVAPKAPSFVAVNKKTGKLGWKSSLPGDRVMRGQWSSPTLAVVNGKAQVLFGGGDGWLYALEPKDGGLIWKFDLNPKKATPYKPGGGGQKSFAVATPVVYDNKVYLAVGQEPDDGPGVGHLWCIDPAKAPANKDKDLSPVGDNFDPKAPANKDSGLVWHYGGPVLPRPADGPDFVFGRTLSTVAIHDGLVYAAELAGYLHCLDAKTGKRQWMHDFSDSTWCSPYYVDGKVFLGTDNGDVLVYRAGAKMQPPKPIAMNRPVKVPPVVANGVIYVNTGADLYAIAPKK
jgi:outer membrane protein assembly factor BamB